MSKTTITQEKLYKSWTIQGRFLEVISNRTYQSEKKMISEKLPKDWKIVEIKRVCEFIRGTEPGSKTYNNEGRGFKFIRVSDISKQVLEGVFVEEESKKLIFCDKEDILLALDGVPGVVAKGFEGAISSGIRIVKSKTSDLDREFLFYILQHNMVQKVIENYTTGTTIKHASRAVEFIRIPLPPLPEQKAIAKILSTVDSAIQRVDEAIAKTEKLKKGLMQELLTKGIGHKEFKYSEELGCEIPKEWEVVRLEDIAEKFISGGTPSTKEPRYWNGNIPWIRSVHISEHYIDELTIEQYITKEGLENSASNIVPKGSLIVATRVGIGKSAVNLIDVAINQDLTGIILNRSKVNSFYLVWYFHSPRIINMLEALSRGTTIKGIPQDYIKKLLIPLPPLSEQQEIAEVLSTVDKKLELERKRKEKLERIKKGLMNDLLTGRKRVKVS